MSEIKFACPHCAQHIACDGDYTDMCIVCPGCGKPMVVPILSATDATHPEICLVAGIPAPRQKFRSHIPMLDPWTEDEWDKHSRTVTGEYPRQTPLWVSILLFIIAAPIVGLGLLFLGCTVCG